MSYRGRGKNPNEDPGVKPVEKIELNVRSPKKGIIIAAILLVVGISFLGYSLFSALSKKPGWTQIENISATGQTLSGEMTLLYELGVSGQSPSAEYKELSVLYSDLCIRAYRIFSSTDGFDNVYNPYYINRHVNEALPVDPALYDAFEMIGEKGSRFLFSAPFYTEYKNMFSYTDDADAEQVDPYKNSEIAEYFSRLSAFTSDEAHVSLELLGDNTVRLTVSEEYLTYAEENGIESFIDFYPYTNAFAVDLIAEELIKKGYTYGSLSSYDGYMRVTDERETEYSYNLYSVYGNRVYNSARYDFKGKNSIVSLRSFPLTGQDDKYYTYKNGEERHPYVDVNDGLCKNSRRSMVAYSKDKGCADVLLSVMDVYVSDSFEPSLLDDVHAVYFEENKLIYTQKGAVFSQLYRDDSVKFECICKQPGE